ncbi:MAG: glycosyltransferase family 2 protein [bacterium]|nr:glycosyltransferase family 2 protein [bacterium]
MKIDKSIIEKEKLTPCSSDQPESSVVIVTYNTPKELFLRVLESLANQTIDRFEVIVVDNSDSSRLESLVNDFSFKYLKLKENYGPSIARNTGAYYSQADILIFLDDDAIPAPDFVEQHIRAYKEHDIVGLRGKALPRTNSIYIYFALNYDLGDKVFPYFNNLEGNSSFRKDIFLDIGGFLTELRTPGHEGPELSYRIIRRLNDKSKLIYYPAAVIYHDNCNSFRKFYRKQKRHRSNNDFLTERIQGFLEFMQSYGEVGKDFSTYPSWLKFRLRVLRKSASLLDKILNWK